MEEGWAQREMAGAALWDRRCCRTVAAVCERRLMRPRVSFSKACGDAVRQGAHRVCSEERTTVDGLLRGHFAQTAQRCRELHQQDPAHPILLVTDTTCLNFSTHPATEGLGPIHQTLRAQGLFAHSVLAVPRQGVPAGLAHVSLWARDPAQHGKSAQRASTPTALKEHQKWIDALWGAEATLPSDIPGLLIADREADFHALFAAPRRVGLDLLVRAYQARTVTVCDELAPVAVGVSPGAAAETGAAAPDLGPEAAEAAADVWAVGGPAADGRPRTGPLPTLVAAAPPLGTLALPVPRQRQQPRRTAGLELRVVPVTLGKPGGGADPLVLWAVLASEPDPPDGVPPLTWLLLTTLPVPDFATAQQVVGYYARRWVIEELHLVLKSAFGAERLQCDDAHTLKNTLALLYVTAWKVLHLRDVARCLPDLPAQEVVDPDELAVLEAHERRPLTTARAVVRALAHFGGFPRNPAAGEPGVRSLWDGLQRLEGAVAGWRLARSALATYEPR